jgi:hypothetical protein
LIEVSLFSPAALGRLLPPYADTQAAGHHSIIMRLWAAVGAPFIFLFIVACCAGSGAVFIAVFLVPAPVLLASVACEALLAALLGRWVPARAVPPPYQGQFWRTMLRCFSTYLMASSVLLCLAVGVMLIGLNASRGYAMPFRLWRLLFNTLPYLAPVATILWWWYGLGQAITARGAPCAARTVIILLIPVFAVAAVVLGMCVGAAQGFVFHTICNG